ncbi:MAG: methyltransferase, TrmA family [Caloramator sp.]|jgi:tRNA (uracil-5-)-methyltransferase|uniref:23S rRNA (uracil(1939)-C(5))-methyltransferase RlmD n=1 Tax=Caloramator sp. TaxID=1871330 RepID=UPI001D6B372F|nr:23S rRNA (uracil(1939)-C(5))-methyltransferase RlmD [Caloramator sp.]MBZ4663584.1 methyltransferase, TrmA family [Caloramator sp.]
MKKGQEIVVEIVETEFPGYGVGYYEDTKVLIKGALIGEKVLARITKKKTKVEAKIVEVLEEVDYKIEAPCPVFGICGGCTHQFIDYTKQLQLKEEQVLKLFKEAGIEGFEYRGIVESPNAYEYRNKMEFTFGDYEKGGELTLGLHTPVKRNAVVSTTTCLLVDRDFRTIVKSTLEYFKSKEVPHYNVLSHQGYLRHLVVRKAKKTGEILVNLVTTSQLDFNLSEYVEVLKNNIYDGILTGIIHTVNDSLSDAVKPDKVEVLYGRDYIVEELLGLKFKISPFSFFQTNTLGAERLYSTVREFMSSSKDKVVFDLYCGTGTIGQIAAQNAKKVIGVELIEEAVEAANNNAKYNGLDNCTFIAGDVKEVIKNIDENPDIIILDPPRPGVTPEALKNVINFKPKEIIYVSCNPKTLVENLKQLKESGYDVKALKIVDMFPQTPHVESVVFVERG